MLPSQPLVSVIIPAYNAAAFLGEALASLQHQAQAPLDIILIDDGSTDDTAALVTAWGDTVRYEYQANQGPAAARNRGLALARGELIAFLDADDRWPAGKLALQVEALQTGPERPAVMGHIQILRADPAPGPGAPAYVLEPKPVQAMLLGCLVARRSTFDQVGGFDPTLRISEDTDWFIRARELGLVIPMVPEVVLHYRRHSESLTSGLAAQDLPLSQVLKRSLDRRRQQGQTR
jgi:glycosyltransferase involved in cell wall biosynthesis